MNRLVLPLALAAVASVACGDKSGKPTDSTAVTVSTPNAPKFVPADFARLRWMQGRWRGQMPSGDFFYEQYSFVDDSTMQMYAFSDPTWTQRSDSSRIVLRGGTVANDGGDARWVATRLDSTGIDFAPEKGAINFFTWTRGTETDWTASVRWTDQQGKPQNLVYPMHRMGGAR